MTSLTPSFTKAKLRLGLTGVLAGVALAATAAPAYAQDNAAPTTESSERQTTTNPNATLDAESCMITETNNNKGGAVLGFIGHRSNRTTVSYSEACGAQRIEDVALAGQLAAVNGDGTPNVVVRTAALGQYRAQDEQSQTRIATILQERGGLSITQVAASLSSNGCVRQPGSLTFTCNAASAAAPVTPTVNARLTTTIRSCMGAINSNQRNSIFFGLFGSSKNNFTAEHSAQCGRDQSNELLIAGQMFARNPDGTPDIPAQATGLILYAQMGPESRARVDDLVFAHNQGSLQQITVAATPGGTLAVCTRSTEDAPQGNVASGIRTVPAYNCATRPGS